MTWPNFFYKDKDNDKAKDKYILRTPPKSNPRDFWHLRHWLQFWQLRTWIHGKSCDLTTNCDTGQHSQFLRCLYTYITSFRTSCVALITIFILVSAQRQCIHDLDWAMHLHVLTLSEHVYMQFWQYWIWIWCHLLFFPHVRIRLAGCTGGRNFSPFSSHWGSGRWGPFSVQWSLNSHFESVVDLARFRGLHLIAVE